MNINFKRKCYFQMIFLSLKFNLIKTRLLHKKKIIHIRKTCRFVTNLMIYFSSLVYKCLYSHFFFSEYYCRFVMSWLINLNNHPTILWLYKMRRVIPTKIIDFEVWQMIALYKDHWKRLTEIFPRSVMNVISNELNTIR